MEHKIPERARNTEVINAIDEYVRLERDRNVLKKHWFGGYSFERLAEEYDVSVNLIKKIIYTNGDKVILLLK